MCDLGCSNLARPAGLAFTDSSIVVSAWAPLSGSSGDASSGADAEFGLRRARAGVPFPALTARGRQPAAAARSRCHAAARSSASKTVGAWGATQQHAGRGRTLGGTVCWRHGRHRTSAHIGSIARQTALGTERCMHHAGRKAAAGGSGGAEAAAAPSDRRLFHGPRPRGAGLARRAACTRFCAAAAHASAQPRTVRVRKPGLSPRTRGAPRTDHRAATRRAHRLQRARATRRSPARTRSLERSGRPRPLRQAQVVDGRVRRGVRGRSDALENVAACGGGHKDIPDRPTRFVATAAWPLASPLQAGRGSVPR